ncbi:hypothetical protein GCM10007159_38830 [Modicisalibacter luteus]|nr:hypothetical protein GCM10007159_38830 [Halomonas lutea]
MSDTPSAYPAYTGGFYTDLRHDRVLPSRGESHVQGGRPRKIGEKEKRLLRQLIEDKPLATLDEMGIRRERATLTARQGRRYGYQPAHLIAVNARSSPTPVR